MECLHYLSHLVQPQWRQRCGLLCLMFTTIFIFRSGRYLQNFPAEMQGDSEQFLEDEPLYSPDMLRPELYLVPPFNELLNITDFRFVKNVNGCASSRSNDAAPAPYLLILVHTAPDHFVHRRVIRSTWGSVKNVDQLDIRLVFLLGMTEPAIQRKLDAEARDHGDIVQGSFLDNYHNLTYKHLMGYKWMLHFCPKTTFVMKADDDVYVDIFRVMNLLPYTFGKNPSNILSCSLFPAKMAPYRSGKWKVSVEEYPYRTYPTYCSGMSIFLTPDVGAKLLAASRQVPFLWIDDVYVTGLLAQAIGLRQLPMNLRFCDNPAELLLWLSHGKNKSNYMVGHVPVGRWKHVMHMLWNKTVKVWQERA